jgi:hypothetical protein
MFPIRLIGDIISVKRAKNVSNQAYWRHYLGEKGQKCFQSGLFCSINKNQTTIASTLLKKISKRLIDKKKQR